MTKTGLLQLQYLQQLQHFKLLPTAAIAAAIFYYRRRRRIGISSLARAKPPVDVTTGCQQSEPERS